MVRNLEVVPCRESFFFENDDKAFFDSIIIAPFMSILAWYWITTRELVFFSVLTLMGFTWFLVNHKSKAIGSALISKYKD